MRFVGIFLYWSLLLFVSTASLAAQVVKIQDETLATYVISLDWLSMGVAALIALTGGAGRTAASLFKESAGVSNAFRETLKDALVALFTGALCFVLITAYSAMVSAPPLAFQATFIFLAGFARGTLINWVDQAFGKALDLGFELASDFARRRVAAVAVTPPAPAPKTGDPAS
jgi:hypothetical protein